MVEAETEAELEVSIFVLTSAGARGQVSGGGRRGVQSARRDEDGNDWRKVGARTFVR